MNVDTITRYEYDYLLDGNREEMREFDTDNLPTITTHWTYDAADRLTHEERTLGLVPLDIAYQYDQNGNRTREIRGENIIRYSYNENDQLTKIEYPDYVSEEYAYDTRGNLASIHQQEGISSPVEIAAYSYDARNQLTSVTSGIDTLGTFSYDYAGRRTQMHDGTLTTDYLWDEFSAYGDVVLETNLAGTTAYTLANGTLISQTVDTGTPVTSYFLTDAIGSTRMLTDGAGTPTGSFEYDAFGNLLGEPDVQSLGTDYLYAGQQFDPMTELYSMRARYYDASVGRFMSRDTWAYNYQNPVELNRYGYVHNNPVMFTDPSGYVNLPSKAMLTSSVGTFAAAATNQIGLWITTTHAKVYLMLAGTPAIVCFLGELGLDGGLGIEIELSGLGCGDAPTGIGRQYVEKLLNRVPSTVRENLERWAKSLNINIRWRPQNNSSNDVDIDGVGTGGRRPRTDIEIDGSPNCANSFSADTEVSTADGDVPIAEIEIGDFVLAYNEETRTIGEYEVTDTISHVDEDIIHLTIDGELIETTAEHPFYTDDGEWIEAEDLKVGERIWSLDGDYGTVEAVVVIEDANQPMYNLTVDEAHTFFIGDGDWLVHNICTISRQLNHGGDDLSTAVQQYRLNNNDNRGANIVAIKFDQPIDATNAPPPTGYIRYDVAGANNDILLVRSRSFGDTDRNPDDHAEYLAQQLMTELNVGMNNIVSVYSEWEPCRSCLNRFFMQLDDNVNVTWTFRFQNPVERRIDQGYRDTVLDLLFNAGVPSEIHIPGS